MEIAGKEADLGWRELSLLFDAWDGGSWEIFKYKMLVDTWKQESEFPVNVIGSIVTVRMYKVTGEKKR